MIKTAYYNESHLNVVSLRIPYWTALALLVMMCEERMPA